jgi:photosystem II stability/assembly factor-like uncharacterized protein
MREVTEKDENLQLTVMSESAIWVTGRAVQLTITHEDGTTYRQQFELKDGELKWISIPVQLVDGNVRIG